VVQTKKNLRNYINTYHVYESSDVGLLTRPLEGRVEYGSDTILNFIVQQRHLKGPLKIGS